jgi:hypothetical protein
LPNHGAFQEALDTINSTRSDAEAIAGCSWTLTISNASSTPTGIRCAQLSRTKRSGQVVVSAGFQALEGVDFVVAGSEHDEVGRAERTDTLGRFEGVHTGHAHVEGRDDRIVGAYYGDTVEAVARGECLEPGLGEHGLQQVTNVCVVFDDDDGDALLGFF